MDAKAIVGKPAGSLAQSLSCTHCSRNYALHHPILPRVLDETIKNINFTKSWILNAHSFNVLCSKEKAYITHCCCSVKYDAVGRKSFCAIGSQAELATFFMFYHLYWKEGLTDKPLLLRLRYWQTFSWKWTKWAYCFKENNWPYFAIKKFEISSEN